MLPHKWNLPCILQQYIALRLGTCKLRYPRQMILMTQTLKSCGVSLGLIYDSTTDNISLKHIGNITGICTWVIELLFV